MDITNKIYFDILVRGGSLALSSAVIPILRDALCVVKMIEKPSFFPTCFS